MTKNTKQWASITAGILSLTGYTSAASLGSEKYIYDKSGNIIEKLIDGKVMRMDYDLENRLINDNVLATSSVCHGYGKKIIETCGSKTNATFYYNAVGQLVAKKTAGNLSIYSWDGNVLAANDTEASVNEAHVSGGIPVLAAGLDVVVSDYLGSTLASGEIQFSSSSYGEGLETGRFTGKPYIEELGGFIFHHRIYSPSNGSWNVSDPSGYPDGPNNSQYVHNNPTIRIDPLGLAAADVIPDPSTDPLYANSGHTRYNQFWSARGDTQLQNLAGYTSSGIIVEVRESFEFFRDSADNIVSIPQNSFVDVECSGTLSLTVSGGISIYSVITFGASGSMGTTVGIKKRVDAYRKNKSDAMNFTSQAKMHRETAYRTVEHRYTLQNGTVIDWHHYTGSANPGSVTSGDIGFTHNKLGIGQYKEL